MDVIYPFHFTHEAFFNVNVCQSLEKTIILGGATILKDPQDGHEHAKVCTKSIGILEDMNPYILEYDLIGILFYFL